MIKSLVTALFLLLTMPVLALAITDDFTVTQQIGSDSTPPTVPGSLVATPVATTQINLMWSTSTDAGTGLSGYQVFRDNSQIATTTSNSYSDIGLIASTTYDYNVTAFDLFSNISARSATSSTTTLPVVATTTPTTTPSGGGGGPAEEMEPIELEILGIQTEVTDTTVNITFDTPGYAIASVRYGQTPQYEIGSSANDLYEKNHRFIVNSLVPNAKYFFEITVSNQRGEIVTYEGSFITKSLADTVPPANVSGLWAVIDGGDVKLSWKNPETKDFDRVRIIGKDNFYPTDMADGVVLYEGSGESFRHKDVYPEYKNMYYTVFALDESGNQSSGAITQVSWAVETRSPADIPVEVEETEISFSDLEFVQDSRIHQGLQSTIDLDPNRPFTIRLPYESVPEHLKTITLTLTDPKDSSLTFAFLLRINERKTHYEATIGALGRQAVYPLKFTFFDFKTKEKTSFNGTISTVPKTEQTYPEPVRTVAEQILFLASRCWWCWLLLLVPLLIAYWLLKRKREDKNGDQENDFEQRN